MVPRCTRIEWLHFTFDRVSTTLYYRSQPITIQNNQNVHCDGTSCDRTSKCLSEYSYYFVRVVSRIAASISWTTSQLIPCNAGASGCNFKAHVAEDFFVVAECCIATVENSTGNKIVVLFNTKECIWSVTTDFIHTHTHTNKVPNRNLFT